jgi:hypothetical protein
MDKPQLFRVRPLALASAGALVLSMSAAVAANAAIPAQPSASVANETLTILGTGGGDDIALDFSPVDPNAVLVELGNGTQPQAFDRTSFAQVSVFLGAGDDTFTAPPGGTLFSTLPISVDGAGGNDIITGGPASDILSGGAGDDIINGHDGNDIIFGGGGDDVINGNRGDDTEILGAGADSALWNPGEGSDTINGGNGQDSLQFNGSNIGEDVALTASGDHAVFTRNVAAIRMDMVGVETFNFAALGGADDVTVGDLSGTDLRTTNVDLSAAGAGDESADTVTVTGTNKADQIAVDALGGVVDVSGLHSVVAITAAETTDHLQVNALGGNDVVSVSDAAQAVVPVSVDLGIGQR